MWMKIDDGLHAHRKTRAALKGHPDKTRDAGAIGIWTLAGSWAAQNRTDGWVPEDELDRWDDQWEALVERLVKAGFWWPHERNGERGYGFTDWHDYNDPADMASKSGTYGNHIRWHVNEKRVDPACDHCPKEPNEPEDRGDIGGRSGGESHPESGGESRIGSGAIALPEPEPEPRPEPVDAYASASAPALIEAPRDDVTRICDHLADAIEANGSPRPTIGVKWRDAARLMLDRDGRTEEEVHGAIAWCQRDEFWRSNILSLPKLRDKYDTLRLQAQRQQPAQRQSRAQGWLDLARNLEAGGQ